MRDKCPYQAPHFCFIKQNEERGCAARGEEISCFATPLARKEFASKLLIICVEHLVKANRKMKLELSANQSGTLNECKRKRSMNLVRGTKIELGLFYI